MSERRVFHAVIWTEASLASPLPAIKDEVQRMAQAVNGLCQILLAPSLDTDATERAPGVIMISSRTTVEEIDSPDMRRYCRGTLPANVKSLQTAFASANIAASTGPLGVVVEETVDAEDIGGGALSMIAGTKPSLPFTGYSVREGRRYFGASLEHVVKLVLSAEGIDSTRALYIVRTAESEPQEVGATTKTTLRGDTIDVALATAAFSNLFNAVVVNTGERPFAAVPTTALKAHGPAELADERWIDLGGKPDVEQGEWVKQSVLLSRPLRLHPRSRKLLDRPAFCELLRRSHDLARKNVEHGRELFRRMVTMHPATGEALNDKTLSELFLDGGIFDHKSGAIAFDPYQWSKLLEESAPHCATPLPEPWRGIIYDHFGDTIEEQWKYDRPNYKRVLAAASTVLLRGEDYYAHLQNISPITRLKHLVESTSSAMHWVNDDLIGYATIQQWKLALAILDHVRNGALQLAWFESMLSSINDLTEDHTSELADLTLKFVDSALLVYYSVLTGKREFAKAELPSLVMGWSQLGALVRYIHGRIKEKVKGWRESTGDLHMQTSRLIRRWREADHPGENLLVALLAHFDFPSKTAIGIGWGGIELPAVYRQVSRLSGHPATQVAVVPYSHYSKSGSKRPMARSFSGDSNLASLSDAEVLVFDDNALSGETLEVVVEFLATKYRARSLAIYVTRLSGERRYDQMRMEKLGALNPSLVGDFVRGHLGETAYSRSWSRTDYENAIGVFSLSRRRILELLFSNSSADRFEREGF